MPPPTRAERDHRMRQDRAAGWTIRALAARYAVSKSQAHRIVHATEILPPPIGQAVLVPAPGGGYAVQFTPGPPHRAYRVRNGCRVAT